MKSIKFKILGRKWELRLMKRRAYKHKNGSDSLAMTRSHKRRIDISPRGLDKATIGHELVHAYIAEMCLHSSDLEHAAFEEFFCELLSKRGQEILNLAQAIYKELKK